MSYTYTCAAAGNDDCYDAAACLTGMGAAAADGVSCVLDLGYLMYTSCDAGHNHKEFYHSTYPWTPVPWHPCPGGDFQGYYD